MKPFRSPSVELIRRFYPDYEGVLFLHVLQDHLVGRIFWPLVDRYVRPTDVAVDLGCGSGTTAKLLGERVATAIGIDHDDSAFGKHALEVANADEPDLHSRRGTFLIKGDIGEIPLADETVDFATSRWVFEHLEDPGAVVTEMGRVIRPGGYALVVVPNRLHPGIFLSSAFPLRLKQWLLRSSSGIEEELVIRTYYRANTEPALDRWFGDAGFKKVGLWFVADPSYWLFSRSLFVVMSTLGRIATALPLSRFRMHIVALYRKAEAEPG